MILSLCFDIIRESLILWSSLALSSKMLCRITLGLVCLIGLAVAQQQPNPNQQQPNPQQQQPSQCRTMFRDKFYGCITNFSMVPAEFLALINNQTRAGQLKGQDPYRDSSCAVEKEFAACALTFMNEMDKSPVCTGNPSNQQQQDEWKEITQQFWVLLGQYDFICAHPCRQTLLPNLRACYQKAELDPELFLSNATAGRGAVIGADESSARQYCEHKDALMACMKNESMSCPDAPALLRNIGLDIMSMEKGVNILCKHVDVYVSGLDCFANATEGVIGCQRDQQTEMVNLIVTAQNTSMEEEIFYSKFCKIRTKHVGCDLRQWALKKHTKCTPGVIGLRTEMECGLMPVQCQESEKAALDAVCHIDQFNRHQRVDTPAGSSSTCLVTSLVSTAVFVLLSQITNYL